LPPAPEPSTPPAEATIARYRAAGERHDADAVAALLAPDVELHSPLTASVDFAGRDEVVAMHRDIFAVLDGIETAEPLALGDERAFRFAARVRGVPLEAMMLARLDADDRIDRLTIYARPLPAVGTLLSALPPRVSARRRGPLTGAVVAVLTRPLAFVLRTADRMVPRFL
jgi:hypothetical protein